MRIGIDLDNTIANYNCSILSLAIKFNYVPSDWKGNKLEIKNYLILKKNGQKNWNKLQGQIYGPYMKKAKVFDGFVNFLKRYLCKKNEIFIISHKTQYGHHDKYKTPLRIVAIDWLKENKIINYNKKGILEENVFFLSTQKEKINKIESLNLDFFIDDLKDVLLLIKNPKIRKIQFQGDTSTTADSIKCFDHWDKISNYIENYMNYPNLNINIETIINDKIIRYSEIKKGVNSKVFKIEGKYKNYALKIYPQILDDEHDRLQTEIKALDILSKFDTIPKIVGYNKKENIAVFDWIEGKTIIRINNKILNDSINFIKNLSKLDKNKLINFSYAKESCIRVSDIISQIENRLELINKTQNKDIINFIRNNFLIVYKNSIKIADKILKSSSFSEALDKEYQILSPSDFGFHNAIVNEKKEIFFIDFEYFGWDDPAKLINDFIWHPGMKLTDKQKIFWANEALSIFQCDKNLSLRVKATWSLFGLRWALIILKEVSKYNRILETGRKLELKDIEKLLQQQLIKSRYIIQKILANNYECPYV